MIWIIAVRRRRRAIFRYQREYAHGSRNRTLIFDLLRQHSILTLATVREDAFSQATTVGYVNDGLTIYVGCGADSQKARNIRRCAKVSLTVDHDEDDWSRIRGLSMGAIAEVVTDPAEIARVIELTLAKFPQFKSMPKPEPCRGCARR